MILKRFFIIGFLCLWGSDVFSLDLDPDAYCADLNRVVGAHYSPQHFYILPSPPPPLETAESAATTATLENPGIESLLLPDTGAPIAVGTPLEKIEIQSLMVGGSKGKKYQITLGPIKRWLMQKSSFVEWRVLDFGVITGPNLQASLKDFFASSSLQDMSVEITENGFPKRISLTNVRYFLTKTASSLKECIDITPQTFLSFHMKSQFEDAGFSYDFEVKGMIYGKMPVRRLSQAFIWALNPSTQEMDLFIKACYPSPVGNRYIQIFPGFKESIDVTKCGLEDFDLSSWETTSFKGVSHNSNGKEVASSTGAASGSGEEGEEIAVSANNMTGPLLLAGDEDLSDLNAENTDPLNFGAFQKADIFENQALIYFASENIPYQDDKFYENLSILRKALFALPKGPDLRFSETEKQEQRQKIAKVETDIQNIFSEKIARDRSLTKKEDSAGGFYFVKPKIEKARVTKTPYSVREVWKKNWAPDGNAVGFGEFLDTCCQYIAEKNSVYERLPNPPPVLILPDVVPPEGYYSIGNNGGERVWTPCFPKGRPGNSEHTYRGVNQRDVLVKVVGGAEQMRDVFNPPENVRILSVEIPISREMEGPLLTFISNASVLSSATLNFGKMNRDSFRSIMEALRNNSSLKSLVCLHPFAPQLEENIMDYMGSFIALHPTVRELVFPDERGVPIRMLKKEECVETSTFHQDVTLWVKNINFLQDLENNKNGLLQEVRELTLVEIPFSSYKPKSQKGEFEERQEGSEERTFSPLPVKETQKKITKEAFMERFFEYYGHLTFLKMVDCFENGLPTEFFRKKGLNSLEKLQFKEQNFCALTEESLSDIAKNFPKLKKIILEECTFYWKREEVPRQAKEQEQRQRFLECLYFLKLDTLEIYKSFISPKNNGYSFIGKLGTQLRMLVLQACFGDDLSVSATSLFSEIYPLSGLTTLDLSFSALSQAQSLSLLPEGLQDLRLAGCFKGRISLQKLQEILMRFRNLTNLDLTQNPYPEHFPEPVQPLQKGKKSLKSANGVSPYQAFMNDMGKLSLQAVLRIGYPEDDAQSSQFPSQEFSLSVMEQDLVFTPGNMGLLTGNDSLNLGQTQSLTFQGMNGFPWDEDLIIRCLLNTLASAPADNPLKRLRVLEGMKDRSMVSRWMAVMSETKIEEFDLSGNPIEELWTSYADFKRFIQACFTSRDTLKKVIFTSPLGDKIESVRQDNLSDYPNGFSVKVPPLKTITVDSRLFHFAEFLENCNTLQLITLNGNGNVNLRDIEGILRGLNSFKTPFSLRLKDFFKDLKTPAILSFFGALGQSSVENLDISGHVFHHGEYDNLAGIFNRRFRNLKELSINLPRRDHHVKSRGAKAAGGSALGYGTAAAVASMLFPPLSPVFIGAAVGASTLTTTGVVASGYVVEGVTNKLSFQCIEHVEKLWKPGLEVHAYGVTIFAERREATLEALKAKRHTNIHLFAQRFSEQTEAEGIEEDSELDGE